MQGLISEEYIYSLNTERTVRSCCRGGKKDSGKEAHTSTVGYTYGSSGLFLLPVSVN